MKTWSLHHQGGPGAALIWWRSKNSQSKEACIIDLGSLLLLLYYLRSKSTIRNVEEKYLREGIWIRYPLIIALFISQWQERANLKILGKSLEDCECWIKKIIQHLLINRCFRIFNFEKKFDEDCNKLLEFLFSFSFCCKIIQCPRKESFQISV